MLLDLPPAPPGIPHVLAACGVQPPPVAPAADLSYSSLPLPHGPLPQAFYTPWLLTLAPQPPTPLPQAFYTFWLPVACGLLLAGETRQEALDLARDICVEIGQYFQVGRKMGASMGGRQMGGVKEGASNRAGQLLQFQIGPDRTHACQQSRRGLRTAFIPAVSKLHIINSNLNTTS